ncbi:MAG: universal stress protein [Pseudomonadales bacterium]
MQPTALERVLIASDGLDGMAVALDKAAMIEHYTGAQLLAVQTVYDRIAEEPPGVLPAAQQVELIEALKAAERRALQAVAGPVQARVASLELQVAWHRQSAEAIADAARRFQANLLIKPVSAHHPLGDYFHTPLDWALMRQAPCPVLVSRRPDWRPPHRILAAVDIADTDHEALNAAVMAMAGTLASVLDAELHVATAYPDLGQRVNALQVATDFEGIKASMRSNRHALLADAIAAIGLEVDQIHVLEGRPAAVIPDLASRIEATVTVLGTAARHGLSKLVIGNTAEDLISRLAGDLLTVRAS